MGTGITSLARTAGLDPDVADILGFAAAAKGPELVKGTGAKISKFAGKVADISPDLTAKAGAFGKVVAQDAAAHIPIAGRFIRRPSFGDYIEAAKTKADPQLALFNKTPKLGNSPMEPPPFPGAKTELSTTPIQDAINKSDLMTRLDAAIKNGDSEAIAKISEEAGLTKPSTVDASGPTAKSIPSQKLPTLEERAASGDKTAQGILKDRATQQARQNMPVEDAKWKLSNPGPKLLGTGSSDVEVMANATKINSPAQALAALDEAAQQIFGKKYADLSLDQKLKTLSEGAKIQNGEKNLTQSGNKQRSNLKKNQRQLAAADPTLVEKYKNQ
jgi:hypothetical protein